MRTVCIIFLVVIAALAQSPLPSPIAGGSGGGGGSGTVTSLTATSPIVVTPTPTTTTGVISCPTCFLYTYSVTSQAPVTETGSLTDLAASTALPSLAAGRCYRYEASFTFTTVGGNSSLLLWYGTTNAAGGVTYGGGNVTGSTTHPITIFGSVCNGAGVQNAQVFTLNTLFQQGAGGFADNASGSQDATLSTLKIGFSGASSGSNNVIVVQYFNIWLI
jgi:hypothetical protein